ncbi:MAG: AEC family transporter [Candidatus Hydrogenedentes bacterium]|nr:AEC family transporter [Candidatus Hydrogenedentota bacterium]
MSAVLSAVLPVFIVAAFGFAVRRITHLHLKTLSALNAYVLIPSLVYNGISKNAIEWPLFLRTALAVVIAAAIAGLVLALIASRAGMTTPLKSAFMMTMFPNLGNFGLPIVLFAFGSKALPYGVLIMVCGGFLQNSVGLYLAQRGVHSAKRALLGVFTFPMVYAFAAAMLAQRLGFQFPQALDRAVQIAGDGVIPIQLLILGATVAETRLQVTVHVFVACAVRLLLGPLVAWGVATIVGMHGLAASVFILQMSGPVAIGMAAYGVQFDLEPGYLSSVVSWTFLFSVATVSVVLTLLYAAG